MSQKFSRKPFANFFIKKNLQIRLIKKIVFAVLISTLVCVATLLLTYLAKYKSAVFYQVTLDIGGTIGNRENIISIILPSLLISSFVNLIIAVFIGFYASRKYAVPIFKLESWAVLLQKGHINTKLQFREKDEMKDLSNNCNQLSEELCDKFRKIKENIENLKNENCNIEPINKIQGILDSMQINSKPIEIQTNTYLKKDFTKEKKEG
ncbi:MAG: hypothetical protein PVI26_06400 [Chitinispirillia bacterium]|jgi:methyl-accepting chemotaxis protein